MAGAIVLKVLMAGSVTTSGAEAFGTFVHDYALSPTPCKRKFGPTNKHRRKRACGGPGHDLAESTSINEPLLGGIRGGERLINPFPCWHACLPVVR